MLKARDQSCLDLDLGLEDLTGRRPSLEASIEEQVSKTRSMHFTPYCRASLLDSLRLSQKMYFFLIYCDMGMSECVDLCSALSLRTPNAVDALVTREQVRFV